MQTHKNLQKQGGFTLIELIAVIVVLGILAAVVVPQFTDLTDDAATGAAAQAEAEVISRFNQAVASFMLQNGGTVPGAADAAALSADIGASPVDLGDYTVTYTLDADGLEITDIVNDTTGTTLNPPPAGWTEVAYPTTN